ncbi:MAG: hypothetical protein KIT09_30285 [Bryobacteraceae bacterium]|nr:hypothetical protein [Bryobacteraceae bacterium]
MKGVAGLVWAAAAAAALAGCERAPESYPPPFQRGAAQGGRAPQYRHFVAMNDPDASSYFVADIGAGLENGAWRWTGARPELRFVLEKVEDLKFTMDFSIAGVTFEQTGPVTISFYVNNRLLETVRYPTFGEKRFEKAVDPSWLEPGEDTIAAARINPPWISPKDGTKLGIILVQAGFIE